MLKIESLRYFESVIRKCNTPKAVADQLHHDAFNDPIAKAAVNDVANYIGGFSNWLDCAHFVIQEVATDARLTVNVGIPPVQGRWQVLPKHPFPLDHFEVKIVAGGEPECRCDSKALASYGHEKGCQYMAWKARKAEMRQEIEIPRLPNAINQTFARRLLETETELRTRTMNTVLKYAPGMAGGELDHLGLWMQFPRAHTVDGRETDHDYRSRIIELAESNLRG